LISVSAGARRSLHQRSQGRSRADWGGRDRQKLRKPRVAASDVKRKIEDALKRSAELDASRISVEAMSSKVTLRGSVRSWAERTEAERAA
jgi:osmotically-inducible protein OsmY